MSDERRKTKKPKRAARTAPPPPPAPLVRVEPAELAPRTEDDWQRFVDGVVDRANRGMRKAGLEHEGVADELFKELFEKDVEAGFDPENHATEAFVRVSARAGASLRIHFADFVTYVRIGAMNQHRHDGAWLDMDWTKKFLLAPLLGLPDGRERIAEGIEFAGQPNVGIRHLREWVYGLTPRKPGALGRPRGESLSLSSGNRLAQAGEKLRSPRQRKAFLKQLATASPEKREALVKGLRDVLEGLQALVSEIDDLDEE